ncbi:MAG: DUF5693 family protein [Bacillota bacterium]
MNKRIFYIIIILALVVSVFGVINRVTVEESNNDVELAFDYNSLVEMQKEYDNQTISLSELKSYGVNSIAVTTVTIEKLIKNDQAILLTRNEISKQELLFNKQDGFWNQFPQIDKSAFLVFSESNNYYNNLKQLKEPLDLEFKEVNDKFIAFFPYWKEDYLSLMVGFPQDKIKEIKDNGLNVVYRFENQDNNDLGFNLLSDLVKESTIVFSGEEILGFPDDLNRTSELFNKNNNRFGYIEAIIGVQDGEDRLAKELNYNLVRVHSVTQDEMNIYTQTKIVERYLRAVKERNIRFFYMRPIIKENIDFLEVKEANKQYITALSNRLETAGYNISRAKPYEQFSNSSIYLMFTAIGVLAAGILLFYDVFRIKDDMIGYVLAVLGIISIFIIYSLFDSNFFRAGLALLSSIVFPSLAVISQLLKKSNHKNIFNYLKAAFITLIGAGFVVSALADISYLTKINQFRGVKLAFIMPLLIITLYYFLEYIVREKDTTVKGKVFELLDINLKVKHLVILAFIGLAGIYYILRTGNFPILDIPAIEDSFRNMLEKILFVRPRFKEFLIGHPAFILGLYFFDDLKKSLSLYFLSLLAVIAQLNILNSFAHIHTPLFISSLRTFHGLWLGLLIGLIGVYIIRLLIKYIENQKVT